MMQNTNLSWKVERALSNLSWTIENSIQNFIRDLLMGSSFEIKQNMYLVQGEAARKQLIVTEPQVYAGKGFDVFYLKFADGFYMPGDILQCAPNIAIRIMRTPIPVGSMYQYEVRLDTKDRNAYLPEAYLHPGARWTKRLDCLKISHWPILDI